MKIQTFLGKKRISSTLIFYLSYMTYKCGNSQNDCHGPASVKAASAVLLKKSESNFYSSNHHITAFWHCLSFLPSCQTVIVFSLFTVMRPHEVKEGGEGFFIYHLSSTSARWIAARNKNDLLKWWCHSKFSWGQAERFRLESPDETEHDR